jgi:AcrR family transcriptional regulator
MSTMSGSRDALLAAATEEFARHGPRGARIQDIVKRAGVNERMIYHHFGSKDGLYKAVLDTQWDAMAAAWAPALQEAATMPPGPGMRRALAGLFDVVAARPLLVSLAMHEAVAGWPTRSLPSIESLPSPVRGLYEKGQREGVFRKDCPFEVAYGVALGCLFSMPVMQPRLTSILKEDLDSGTPSPRLRDQIIEQIIDGMSGPVDRA